MPHHERVSVRLATLLFVATIPACTPYGWQPFAIEPANDAGVLPTRLRVQRLDGVQIELDDPAQQRDTLRGWVVSVVGSERPVIGPYVTLRLPDLAAIEVWGKSGRISTGRAVVGVGVIGAVGVVLYAILHRRVTVRVPSLPDCGIDVESENLFVCR